MSETKVDCQGEDPNMILVDDLRESARLSANLYGSPVEIDPRWKAAEALLSLSQERDRLREALKPFGKMDIGGTKYVLRYAHPGECADLTVDDLRSARAALHKDQAS